ncbi:unnamed protein product [Prorocentrum cordatum]|uniref:Cation/H+ exchanger domain-containing protein n=1 Tax=Prorocentrum cordatum TaxID=2364126 RepID=A0ABN9S2H7_9DINO|nr:unnamed protein product [Polarella glacialis]
MPAVVWHFFWHCGGSAADVEPLTFGRFTAQLQRVTAMIVGWSLFYSADGLVTVHFPYMVGVIKRVVVALGVTLLSMACIFAMGDAEETFIKYSFKTEKESTLVGGARPQLKDNFKEIFKFLRSTERGMATLIGFAWEQLFDLAVVSISHADSASQVVPPCVTKLLLALVLAGMVIPSWRLYILPLTAPLTDSLEEEDDKEWEDAHLQHNPSQTESLLRRLTIEDAVDVRLVPRLSRRRLREPQGEGGGAGEALGAGCPGASAARSAPPPSPIHGFRQLDGQRGYRQLAESDAELDASLERLGELEQRSAALLACQAPG